VGTAPGGDPVGKVLGGKYRVVRRVGGGAVADVYEVVHEQIGGRLALKVLRREFARFPDVSRRFLNEARAAGAAGHQGIIQVFDIGQLDSGELFMVMELLQGEDLSTLLMKQGRLDPPRAVAITVQLLDALEAAHKAGVIHRDLKPENVLLQRGPGGEDWVKIIDFGIARLTQDGPSAFRRTAEGSVLGSPYYMSPEQARGLSDLDVRTDIYAAGVMLYEMITGELPYNGTSIQGIVEHLLNDPFPHPRDVVPSLPASLEEAILQATARNRDQRFSSAAEFADALRPFRGEWAADGPPGRRAISGRHPATAAAGGSAEETEEEAAERIGRERSPKVVVPARVYAVTIGAAVAAALAVVIVVLWIGRGESDGHAADPVRADAGAQVPSTVDQATASIDAGTLPVPDAATVVALVQDDAGSPEPTRDVAATPETQPPGPDAGVASPKLVRVKLEGMPEGAAATLDGKSVEAEFEVEASAALRLLEVTARGYKPFRRELAIEEQTAIQVTMERRVSPPRDGGTPPVPDAGGPPAVQDAGRRGETGFAPNPFGG
jgi:serine/threonine-protein kinase